MRKFLKSGRAVLLIWAGFAGAMYGGEIEVDEISEVDFKELLLTGGISPPENFMPDEDEWSSGEEEGWVPSGEFVAVDVSFKGKAFQLPGAKTLVPGYAEVIPEYSFQSFQFSGNSVFSDEELSKLLEGFRGERWSMEDLNEVAATISRRYVQDGYFSSGAVIPNQELNSGVLKVEVIEGSLKEIRIRGNDRLNGSFVEGALMGEVGEPLQFSALQRRLQILQKNPNIQRINAELKPGSLPGEAFLDVEMEEEDDQESGGVVFHNQRPPSIGGEQIDLWFQSRNLSGVSDELRLNYGLLEGGIRESRIADPGPFSLSYRRPLRGIGGDVELIFDHQDYAIFEEPFDALNIEGANSRYGVGYLWPMYQSLNDVVTLRVGVDHRRSTAELLGERFSLSPGFVDGRLNTTSLRLGADWLRRTQGEVMAVKTGVSLGLDGLGTEIAEGGPEGDFLSWFATGQYLKKLGGDGRLLVIRGGLQLTNDWLPSAEQQTLGGLNTVRGFRENSLVRDSGGFFGVDYQAPFVELNRLSSWDWTWVAFCDGGYAWSSEDSEGAFLGSCGIGVVAKFQDSFRAEIYYGLPFESPGKGKDDLQDHGIHFRMTLTTF